MEEGKGGDAREGEGIKGGEHEHRLGVGNSLEWLPAVGSGRGGPAAANQGGATGAATW